MGARRRITRSVRASHSVGRIVAGILVSGVAVGVALDLGGPAGADSTGTQRGVVPVVSSVPAAVIEPAPVPPAAAPVPTTVPPTRVPTAPAMASAASSEKPEPQPQPQPQSQSQSQPQPAIGAPAGTNPWDDPNAG
jgi:hypothetical protein